MLHILFSIIMSFSFANFSVVEVQEERSEKSYENNDSSEGVLLLVENELTGF